LISVILAGGEGRRLRPLSTPENPKQFIRFDYLKGSLFQASYKRAMLVSDEQDIFTVTNARYVPKAYEQLNEISSTWKKPNIIGEPEAKNTLPAIMAGVMESGAGENDIVAVFPADHHIGDIGIFSGKLVESEILAENTIVTFGVKPVYPETGYGYIEPGDRLENGFKVLCFREKPDEILAMEYINRGFLWNSGIFMFRAGLFMKEVRVFEPDIFSAFSNSGGIDAIFQRIEKGISIDKGLLEKSSKVSVVPIDMEWSDLGSFEALYRILPVVYESPDKGDIVTEVDGTHSLVNKSDGSVFLRGSHGSVLLCRKT